jgi:metal-responsive CopG/Arc/MetJ family transcriptional regulator
MSKMISLKLDEGLFEETEKTIKRLGKPRNTYINEAVAFLNKRYRKKELAELLVKESALVYASSMEVLKEMETMDDEDEGDLVERS